MDGYYGYAGPAAQQSQAAVFRPSKPEDWEPYRDIIAHLYNTMNMKLKDVMAEMEATYTFKATEKQYKTQLKKWNLDTKYIKASEYMFMIKTMRERQAQEPPKETRFVLRGRVVDPKDIARFEKRAQKKGAMKEGEPIECEEPVEDLVYGTPPPDESYSAAAYQQAYESYEYDSAVDYPYSY
ncbi:1b61e22c-2f0b-4aed-8aad-a42d7b09f665 [Thermothielavioides terrestris]|uniref:1b61e22c-2f0b-4aed-8aad-a42d7b09f665 n=1 Tax=Thermothielavioides terrestris TaxID=2587410 RepID=A0A3S5CW89_9PEZI|nr:1b61e22c-2f0b-4aed-8aad-a42d7b09f665 [Thermothielavioides terrestris]